MSDLENNIKRINTKLQQLLKFSVDAFDMVF